MFGIKIGGIGNCVGSISVVVEMESPNLSITEIVNLYFETSLLSGTKNIPFDFVVSDPMTILL